MKKILIIGIGAGDPDYVTMQAVNALNRVDVFFLMDKGPSKTKLIELRQEICRRYIRGNGHRFVDATSPEMDARHRRLLRDRRRSQSRQAGLVRDA